MTVELSVHSQRLSVSLPCGCRVAGGRYAQYCGQGCDWFRWSDIEIDRAGRYILHAVLAKYHTEEEMAGIRPMNVLEHIDPDDELDALFISSDDFKMHLHFGGAVLGPMRNIAA